ncbi:unnamed protein product [Rhizophagus irregularis]|nr:unnamed protein product [Rhizophagus irregularis]
MIDFPEDAIKELVHEIELQREVTFHNNVISFHGVTISDQENQSNNIKKYLLVMEYADGGSLSNFILNVGMTTQIIGHLFKKLLKD